MQTIRVRQNYIVPIYKYISTLNYAYNWYIIANENGDKTQYRYGFRIEPRFLIRTDQVF